MRLVVTMRLCYSAGRSGDIVEKIEDYLRHTPPMRLVDELLDTEENSVTTAVTITRDCTFFSDELQGVPAWVGLEYMAQSAAVWVGLDNVRHNRPVELGFLVSARQYQAHQPVFPLGERFIVKVNRQFGEDAIAVFDGVIHAANGESYAEAQFTAYRPDDVNAYLRGEIQ